MDNIITGRDLYDKWELVTEDQAKRDWDKQYIASSKECVHKQRGEGPVRREEALRTS